MEPSAQTPQRGKWRKLFAYMIMLFGGAAAITYLIINLLNVVVTYSLNEPAELKQVTAREAAAAFGIAHNREYPLSFVSSTDEMKRAATSDDAMFFIGDTESLANGQEKYLTF
ncbi:MAG: hypothetical protein Q4A34_04135 [Candidatus Saccharibacteria bacterium]|nr:hypothetical protein [Candidatus Saccharibacteria bacterium]